MLTTILALTLAAHAGKLADGVRGVAWGKQAPPAPLAGATCSTKPEPGIPWTCATTVGATPVSISPGYQHGHVYAMLISAKGGTECRALMDTLTAAYGPSRPISDYLTGPLDDRAWFDGDVIGTWGHNEFSQRCQFVAVHMPSQDAVKAGDAKKAAGAVGDL